MGSGGGGAGFGIAGPGCSILRLETLNVVFTVQLGMQWNGKDMLSIGHVVDEIKIVF